MIGAHVFRRMSFFGFKKDRGHLELSVLKLSSYIMFLLEYAFQQDFHCLSDAGENLVFFCFSVDTYEGKKFEINDTI